MQKKRVVITGMGAITPVGIGVDAYWNALLSGVSGVGQITLFDTKEYSTTIGGEVKNFDPQNFITDRKKIRHMARFTQFGVAAAHLAITDAGIDMNKEDPFRVGVIIGSGIGGLSVIEEEHAVLLQRGPRKVSPYLIPMLISNIVGGEIAILYGMKGVNYAVSSACATSAHALGDALRALLYGDADVILAGGAEAAITPLGLAGFCAIKALSLCNSEPTKASRPFDKNRDGFVMAEGAGVLVLETLEHAQKRGAHIYAEFAGYGASNDAYHITAPDPSADASSNAMSVAIRDAGLLPHDIDYINAHGTSTEYNDRTETQATKRVFGERAYTIPISSTKSMTGHLLGAAGAIEAIACVKTIQTGIVHPTINYEEKDPECDLDYVPNVKRNVGTVRAILSNSLGFGGHNASIVIKNYVA